MKDKSEGVKVLTPDQESYLKRKKAADKDCRLNGRSMGPECVALEYAGRDFIELAKTQLKKFEPLKNVFLICPETGDEMVIKKVTAREGDILISAEGATTKWKFTVKQEEE